MTAYRIVTDHTELDNVGQLTHAELDGYVLNTPWIILSGATGPIPSNARLVSFGEGLTVTDGGPSGQLSVVVNQAIISGALNGGGGSITSISWLETPSGPADGTNLTFSLQHSPQPASSLMFFINGVLQMQGTDNDYLITSGSQINLLRSYRSGSNVIATYPFSTLSP